MEQTVNYIESYNIANYNKSVALLYRNHPDLRSLNLFERVERISSLFLGQPYILGANGEGHEGRFDQAPLYRFDAFDCVTYLNTVLALALSNDVVNFRRNLVRIAYRDSQLAYQYRHHFLSVDWNLCNQTLGLIEDITRDVLANDGLIEYAQAYIDRPSWFEKRSYQDIRLLRQLSEEEEAIRLDDLRSIAKTLEAVQSSLPYIPLKHLFDDQNNPRMDVFQKIPNASIIEVVRPDWQLKDKIGTNINVSHVGFAIWKHGEIFYRQASSIEKCVSDVPMADYLRSRLESPTIKGINVLKLLEA